MLQRLLCRRCLNILVGHVAEEAVPVPGTEGQQAALTSLGRCISKLSRAFIEAVGLKIRLGPQLIPLAL